MATKTEKQEHKQIQEAPASRTTVARCDSGAGKAARGEHALEGRRRVAARGGACGGFRGRDLRGWVALLEAHLTLTSPE